MNIVYAFIGPLPLYSVDTVFQTRLFFDGPIYFIISDYHSPLIKKLEDYNVTIVRYETLTHKMFNYAVKKVYNKFCILKNLNGREKLFIYSFERFFVLLNLMKQRDLKNVFFMELDNLIYQDPSPWLEQLSKSEMAFMFDNEDRFASGVCYIKNTELLETFCEFAIQFILYTDKFVSEMGCLSDFYKEYKERIQLLPIHWADSTLPKEAHETFPLYNSIFDSAGMGIFIGGLDPFHRDGQVVKGLKGEWSLIDYTKYSYKWEADDRGRKIPYVLNGSNWIRINNLHIHSKELCLYLSSLPLPLPNRHVLSTQVFSEVDIQRIYLTEIKLPPSYFNKYNTIPDCPVKAWKYQWGDRDCSRIFTILDFKEWIAKHNIISESFAVTCMSDPEIQFIDYKKLNLIEYPENDLHTIDFPENFDFFLFSQTLEHLYNPLIAIQNIYKSLKPGGYVFTSVPTINIPHSTPIHYGGYNPMGLGMLFKSIGFDIVEIGQFGNFRYIEHIFKKHDWVGYDTLNINGKIENEERNVCQCWILARKPLV